MTLLVVVGSLLVLAAAIRSLPHLLAPAGAGVDHWFWKSYVETYRRNRVFPPVLPQYTLDDKQWYPPLFPLLLARLPPGLFESYSPVIAIGIDMARMLLLLGAAHWLSDGNLVVIAMAGLIYATIPIQTSYNVQLNPRGLGALMLELVLMLLLWVYALDGAWWVWIPIVVLSALILLTHKMTTQLLWFMVLGTAVIYHRPLLVALIPASILAALVLSRGFYWKVLRAHWDIVSFWNRNWRWIGADQLRESPIYGDGSYERPQKLHRSGLKGLAWQCYVLFGFNPSVWIACLLVYDRLVLESPRLIYPTYLLVWLLLPCIFALLTTFTPVLKCLGAGYLYVYNTSLLAALLLALSFQYTRAPEFSTPIVALALALNTAGLATYYVRFYRDRRARVDSGLNAMIDALRPQPRGIVMCVPGSWYEVVSYKTGHPVLWGGHGYGFKRLEPTWPRLLMPIGELLRRYDVRYLLTMDGVLPPTVMAELPPAAVIAHEEYRLYCFDKGEERSLAGFGARAEGAAQARPRPGTTMSSSPQSAAAPAD
jgi:hypothetical protein